jgi:hypothetical protein
MAGLVESFIFKMVVDNQQFKRGMEEATKATQDANAAIQKTDGLLRQTSSAFLGVAAVQASMNFVKESLNAAAELENVKATADRVFGDSADIITEWAKDSVEAVGLSERAAIQGATTIAALGKAAGLAGPDLAAFSKDLVKYATDLGQLYNTSTEDALAAIQSGFSGSSIEPLRRYNIILNDTILKQEYLAITGENVTGVLTTQQRMVAFLSAFQKQAADSVGQWNREYDGWLATSQRFSATLENFKADVGDNFVGPVSTAVDTLTTAIGWFAAFDGATQGLGSTMVIAGASLGILVPVLGSLVPRLKDFYAAVRAGESGLGKNVALFAAAVAAIRLYDSAVTSAEEKTTAIDDAFEKMATGAKSVQVALDEMNAAAEPGVFANFANLITGNEQKFDDLNVSADELKKRFTELAEQSPKTAAAVYDLGTRTESGRRAWAQYGVTVQDLKRILDDQVRKQFEAQEAQRDWSDVLADSTDSIYRNEKAWDDYMKGLDDLEKAADDARSSIKNLMDEAGNQFSQDFDATIARQQLVVDIAELQKLQSETVKPEEQAQRDLDILQKQKAIREDILAIVDADVSALGDANGKALEGKALYEAQLDALTKLKVERPDLAAEIDLAIAEIQQQQPGIDVALNVLDPETFAAKVRAALDEGGAPTIAVDLLVDQGFSETDADNIIRQIPSEKVVDIIASTTKLQKELGLTDEEFLDITVRALTEGATTEIDTLIDTAWKTNVQIDPRTADAERAIDRWITDQEGKTIDIKVAWKAISGIFGGGGAEVVPSQTRATAGQPIVNNFITNLPSAARPEEVVSALQTWARRNGTVQVVT